MYIVQTYAAYLLISIALTVWVARTLHKNGRVFLIESFGGQATLADSVNQLLVVGFYLINIGFVVFALKESRRPRILPRQSRRSARRLGSSCSCSASCTSSTSWCFPGCGSGTPCDTSPRRFCLRRGWRRLTRARQPSLERRRAHEGRRWA